MFRTYWSTFEFEDFIHLKSLFDDIHLYIRTYRGIYIPKRSNERTLPEGSQSQKIREHFLVLSHNVQYFWNADASGRPISGLQETVWYAQTIFPSHWIGSFLTYHLLIKGKGVVIRGFTNYYKNIVTVCISV